MYNDETMLHIMSMFFSFCFCCFICKLFLNATFKIRHACFGIIITSSLYIMIGNLSNNKNIKVYINELCAHL